MQRLFRSPRDIDNVPSKTHPPAAASESAPAEFKAIRSARAFEEIAAQIRGELVAGRLKVGSRLPSERALAEKFGVSRNTLREALRSLEHAGLLKLQKGASGGAFITERSADAIITGLLDLYHLGAIGPAQLTEARIWLESVVVREACARATPADLAALRLNIAESTEADARGDFPLRAKKNLEFHRILARMTGNPIMVIVMDGLLDVLLHFVHTIGPYPLAYVLPSRRRFVKHLEAADADAAVREMELSLRRLQRNYLSSMDAVASNGAKDEPAASGARAPVARSAPTRKPAAKRRPAPKGSEPAAARTAVMKRPRSPR